ncbi:MAG TPA: hypothetical protein VFE02_19815 [Candidatus Acidoferrales bacterium]|nr:hypothetical protein [Candidatus Acidoferrales bacterium]
MGGGKNEHRWRVAGAALALAASFCVTPAVAQHLRPPTAAESSMLKHYSDTVHKVLDQFGSDNWEESVDYDVTDDVTVHDALNIPLDIDEMMERSYTIRNGSKLYEQEIEPFAKKLENIHDPAEMAKLAAQLKLNRMTVEVHFNRVDVGIDPPPPGNQDLHIPGAALAYRVSNYKFDKGTSVILLFGDWKSAAWKAADGAYKYKFKHAPHQPAIENIEIHFDGSPERIDELLRTVKWEKINDALSNP